MFGVDLDNEPQASFFEQTGASSPPDKVGEDMPVSTPVLSRGELKKKQQEALKALIAEDLGHSSDQISSAARVHDRHGYSLSLVSRLHHVWSVLLSSPRPKEESARAADQADRYVDLPCEEQTPVMVSFMEQVTTDSSIPVSSTADVSDSLEDKDDFTVFTALAQDAHDTGQPADSTEHTPIKRAFLLPSVEPRTLVFSGLGIVSVLIVGILITGGHAQQVERDCTSAVSAYEKTYSTYTSHLNAARTLLDSTDKTSLVDATLLDELSRVVKSPVTKMTGLTCTVGSFDTQAADRTLTRVHGATDTLTAAQNKIRDLEKSIGASIQAKKLTDAKNAAQATLDEATSLYASSDGQVADNTTRDTLKTQIDALDTALKDKKTTVETLSEKMQEAQSAIDQVNSSVQAKKDADAATAAAAAQAQAQAQQQAQAQSVPVVPRSRSGSSGGAVPRRSSPSTPSVPSGSPSWSVPSDPGEAYLPGSLN